MPTVSTPTPALDAAAAGVPRTPDTSRIVGIDGLRALAVLGVMAFHADWLVAQGGFFGVDLFFVISGFLITRLLLVELERDGRISFRGFYLRRARRILPAMATAIAGAALAAAVLAPDALPMLRVDAVASALFVTNWHFIFQKLSYFEYIGRQPLLQHLWSLAIEEQFYLLWPLVVLALGSRGGRRVLGAVAVAAAVASCVWMGWLADRLGFPESMAIGRVYFGTDTHAMGLLAGAALAAAAPAISAWARPDGGSGEGLRLPGALLGIAGLAGTGVLFSQVGENHPWLYPWAFVASALCSAAMIVACLTPGPFGRALDLQPLRWIGERSYGIYLWHWPVFMLTRPGVDLLLLQRELPYRGTALWLGNRRVRRHFHVRPGVKEDRERMARQVFGGNLSVALGGGGARGFAHVGLLRACEEMSIPVDRIGGTSIGSIVGGLAALGLTSAEVKERLRLGFVPSRKLKDWSLPVISFDTSRRYQDALERIYGDVLIEDLPTNFFCVSCNLTRARGEIHRSGPLRKWVGASISYPLIAPPLVVGGEMLVDGGLINNVPVDIARGDGAGFVLGVDVGASDAFKLPDDYHGRPGAWEVLCSRVGRGGRVAFPTMIDLISRVCVLGSLMGQARARPDADLYLRMPIEKYRLLDFDFIDEIAEIGYQTARSGLQPMQEWRRKTAAP